MKYVIDRLWKGKASLRSYQVDEAIAANKNIEVIHGNRSMVLTPKDLMNGVRGTKEFESKIYPGMTYTLVEFEFREK